MSVFKDVSFFVPCCLPMSVMEVFQLFMALMDEELSKVWFFTSLLTLLKSIHIQ